LTTQEDGEAQRIDESKSSPSKPTILLTNDDGVVANGLIAMKAELDRFAHVEIYAPDRNWSAASRTMTFHKPLRVEHVFLPSGGDAHMTSGSPADCVALALMGLLEENPRLVVSGINAGINVGQDITYSGTVSAAMEAVRSGIPTIAVSQDVSQDGRGRTAFDVAARFTAGLARFLLEHPVLPQGVLLNVNIPANVGSAVPEVRLTRQGGEAHSNHLVRGRDPRGREFYWIAGELMTGGSAGQEGTDIWAVANGYISVTPIHLDMTDYSLLETLSSVENLAWADE